MIFLLETCCVAWFIIEFLVRFGCCPNRVLFCQDWMNLVDLAAILPYFITISLDILMETSLGEYSKPGLKSLLTLTLSGLDIGGKEFFSVINQKNCS